MKRRAMATTERANSDQQTLLASSPWFLTGAPQESAENFKVLSCSLTVQLSPMQAMNAVLSFLLLHVHLLSKGEQSCCGAIVERHLAFTHPN